MRLTDIESATLNVLRVGAGDGRKTINLMGWKNRKEKQLMRESQFIGIFFGILIIMLTTEIGFITICSYLKEIKQLLEKYINKNTSERK